MSVKIWPAGALPPVHLKLYQMKQERAKCEKRLRFSLTNRSKRSILVKESREQ